MKRNKFILVMIIGSLCFFGMINVDAANVINKNIKDKIKDINIEKILEDTSKQSELKKVFDQIEENYSIKIAEYNKEFYKQGFIDGVNLMINCLKT